jgi:hypothetical protein
VIFSGKSRFLPKLSRTTCANFGANKPGRSKQIGNNCSLKITISFGVLSRISSDCILEREMKMRVEVRANCVKIEVRDQDLALNSKFVEKNFIVSRVTEFLKKDEESDRAILLVPNRKISKNSAKHSFKSQDFRDCSTKVVVKQTRCDRCAVILLRGNCLNCSPCISLNLETQLDISDLS